MLINHITEDDLRKATQRLANLPTYNNSHRGHAANQIGTLGETIVRKHLHYLNIQTKPVYTTSHDLELPDGQRIEIKTKDRTVPPRPDYECSIPLYNHLHQNVDWYIFVSLQRDKHRTDHNLDRFHTAYIVGVANQHTIATKAETRHTGQQDPRNGTTFWTDCRNIYIRDLMSLPAAVKLWKTTQVRSIAVDASNW